MPTQRSELHGNQRSEKRPTQFFKIIKIKPVVNCCIRMIQWQMTQVVASFGNDVGSIILQNATSVNRGVIDYWRWTNQEKPHKIQGWWHQKLPSERKRYLMEELLQTGQITGWQLDNSNGVMQFRWSFGTIERMQRTPDWSAKDGAEVLNQTEWEYCVGMIRTRTIHMAGHDCVSQTFASGNKLVYIRVTRRSCRMTVSS